MVYSFKQLENIVQTDWDYIRNKGRKALYASIKGKSDNKTYDQNYGHLEATNTSNARIIQTKNYESLLNISKGAMLFGNDLNQMCLKVGATDLSGC